MPEPLQRIHTIQTKYTAPEEMHENLEVLGLGVDQQQIAKIAVLSELAAGSNLDSPGEAQSKIINPITKKQLKPRKTFDDEGRTIKEVPQYVEHMNDVLSQEQDHIEELVDRPDDIKRALTDSVGVLRRTVRGARNRPNNLNTILAGSKLSPFLHGQAEKSGDWISWLDSANDEQVVNFAQAYNAEAAKILDPEQREEEVKKLKQSMQEKVDGAIEDGWIDGGHRRKLGRAIRRSEVLYFSPFSPFADRFAGMNFEGALARRMVILPVAVGEHIATHEFSHRLQRMDAPDIAKHVQSHYTSEEVELPELPDAITELATVLNEAITEHIALSLQHGAPEIIDPQKRQNALGEAAERDSAAPYQPFREVLSGLLRADTEPPLSIEEIRTLTTSVIKRDIKVFASLVSSRWGGQDKLAELTDVAFHYLKESKKNGTKDMRGFVPALLRCVEAEPQVEEMTKAA
jgi:hypothetical protein